MTKSLLKLVPECVEEASDGPLSFEKYAVPFYVDVKIFAKKLCSRNPSRSDDLVQTVMLKALENWDTFVPDERLTVKHAVRAWLYRICANTFATDFNRNVYARDTECYRADDIVDAMHGYGDPDPRKQIDSPLGDEVLVAIQALSTDHRAVIDGFYLRDMNCAEIAEEIGITKNTVFTRIGRAKVALSKTLVEYARVGYGIKDEAVAVVVEEEVAEVVEAVAAPVAPRAPRWGNLRSILGSVCRVSQPTTARFQRHQSHRG